MSQHIAAHDERLAWDGATSLERIDNWVKPWRIDYRNCDLHAPALATRAAYPAGIRITFETNTAWVAGTVDAAHDCSPIDVVCNGQLLATLDLHTTNGPTTFRFDGLPLGNNVIELWLPQYGDFRIHHLEIANDARLSRHYNQHPRWITYGSSITQCRTADSPTQTWPAIVARAHQLNFACLGFGGQCHLDTMIARQIRDTPADYLSMCVGINIYGHSSLSQRTFAPSIIGFVQIVREKHPTAPLVIMSPIHGGDRETQTNAVGFTLQHMRREIQATVATLQRCGDDNVHYLDGLDVLGSEAQHLLADGIHPNGEGYRLMGKNFGRLVVNDLFAERPHST